MKSIYSDDARYQLEIRTTQTFMKIFLVGILCLSSVLVSTYKMTYKDHQLNMWMNILISIGFTYYLFYQLDFNVKPIKRRIRFMKQLNPKMSAEVTGQLIDLNETSTLHGMIFHKYGLVGTNKTIVYIDHHLWIPKHFTLYHIDLTKEHIVVNYDEA